MQIWAIGGGKGGTGKSLVSNGLGVHLAEHGQHVVLVDTDYGGPNQHTYCGIRNPPSSLVQFFEEKRPLDEIVLHTKIDRLHLIPGNINSHNTDNLTTTQKQKLFRHLLKLKTDHLILDLGAGTQYDTLDTFMLAEIQVAVIAPDALAIENFYLFLKNLRYRQLANVLSRLGLRERMREIWKARPEYGISTMKELIAYIGTIHPEFTDMFEQEKRRLKIHLVLNQVREYRQVEMGLTVKSAVNKFFRIPTHFAGYIRYDKDFWHQFGHGTPAIHPGASFGLRQDLERVIDAILNPRAMEMD